MSASATDTDKQADLAGPGIGNYEDLEKVLPDDYASPRAPGDPESDLRREEYIEEHLCKELNLTMVQVPLIVEADSGVNDMLDRDGSRTPVQFHISNDHDQHPIDAQVVQAATKWKRMALRQFGWARRRALHRHARGAEGLLPRPRPQLLRRPVGLGDRSSPPTDRNLDFLKETVREDLEGPQGRRAGRRRSCSRLRTDRYPDLPDEITFIHAEDLLACIPTSPASSARPRSSRSIPAVFIIGIGWTLETASRTRCGPPTTTTG